MIYAKNRLIIGFISKIIKTVFGLIYKVLKLFNLQLPLLILVASTILFFVGALENPTIFNVVKILFVITVVLSLVKTVSKVLGIDKKKIKKTKSGVQITNPTQAQATEQKPAYPIYYAVKGSSDYVMGEFEDRFELYKKTPQGLMLVRVDYKERRI